MHPSGNTTRTTRYRFSYLIALNVFLFNACAPATNADRGDAQREVYSDKRYRLAAVPVHHILPARLN